MLISEECQLGMKLCRSIQCQLGMKLCRSIQYKLGMKLCRSIQCQLGMKLCRSIHKRNCLFQNAKNWHELRLFTCYCLNSRWYHHVWSIPFVWGRVYSRCRYYIYLPHLDGTPHGCLDDTYLALADGDGRDWKSGYLYCLPGCAKGLFWWVFLH